MLTHFSVKNYKCLADVSLPLTPIHVIIGQNDSGKTSLLEAMKALFKSASVDLEKAFPGEWDGRELVYERSATSTIGFTATLAGEMDGSQRSLAYCLDVKFRESGRMIYNQLESINGKQILPGRNPLGTWVHEAKNLAPGPERDLVFEVADSLRTAYFHSFNPKSMAIPAALNPARKFRMASNGFGLSTLLDDILGYDFERFSEIRRDFCRFFPQFRNVRLETETISTRQTDANGRSQFVTRIGKGIYLETIRGTTIRARQASDGVLLFLGLLALIHSPEPPKLLLIEEPEKGVYPKRLEEVIGLIRRLQDSPSNRHIPQVVMSTHSPYLLSFFQPEEVTFLRRDGETGPVRAWPLRDAPHIMDRLDGGAFYLGELWYNLSEEEIFGSA